MLVKLQPVRVSAVTVNGRVPALPEDVKYQNGNVFIGQFTHGVFSAYQFKKFVFSPRLFFPFRL